MNKHSITALIYDKHSRVISIGKNSYIKTHPLQAFYAEKVGLSQRIYLHAEIDAIIRCKDLSKAHRIMVTRINKSGNFALAKPCPICVEALRNTQIKQVDYT